MIPGTYGYSIACYKSGYYNHGGGQLVVVPHYNRTGQFGYVITYQYVDKGTSIYRYKDHQDFVESIPSQDSYQQAIDILADIITDTPTLKTSC